MWELHNITYKIRDRTKKTRIRCKKTKTVAWVIPPQTGISHEDRELKVDSGASMHRMSKNDFFHGESETIRKSKESCTSVTANGKTTTTEEPGVCVRHLDIFVCCRPFLEDSPAAPAREFCEEHGYSCEGKENTYPHSSRMATFSLCKSEKCAPISRTWSHCRHSSIGRPRARYSKLASAIYGRTERSVGETLPKALPPHLPARR